MKNNKELKEAITKLVRLAKRVYPHLEYEVKTPGHEDEDAALTLYCPIRYEKKIFRAISDMSYKLLSEKNIFIVTFVYHPNHKPRKKAS